ncbi:MAG: crossover junction endodeoxyribonuclease RuvC [Nitrosomonas sp.]|uniref:crossover junction endodeoxyribonuclease RuvC n=1 Tax=Nitrosomonas sp. TaxID=42353 RepID=UPI001E0FB126|nr:crossover junction endodeoxyribonuclease RuvC [Nitrosomonas sp.]MBX9893576.1 crossover junction endodeoxyribonuclease RuvC [Nitrosomonas sp.]
MRILGIDPGLRITGFGVIEKNGGQLTYVCSGSVKTSEGDLPSRLKEILENVRDVIEQYQPDHVAIEQVFVNINPKSTLLLGQARGAAICAAVVNNLKVAEYTALQIKQAVVGKGHASKDQVQQMIVRLLNLPAHPSSDAADALACAVCHAHGGLGLGKISTAGFRMKRGRLV